MNLIQSIKALGPIDFNNVRRDPMLRWMVFFPLLMVGIFRWGIPFLAEQLKLWLNFDLLAYDNLMMSFVSMMIPLAYGSVVGFLLLDQRDDRTLFALQVTPLTLRGYFIYRVSLPMFLGLLGNLIFLPLSGFVNMGWEKIFMVSLGASGLTPVLALFYAGFAQNKVQGMALMKISSLIFMPVIVAWFLTGVWHWLFAILPSFWPMKLYWVLDSGGSGAGLCLLGAWLSQLIIIKFLLDHFRRVCEV